MYILCRIFFEVVSSSVSQCISDLNSSFSFSFSTDNRESFPVYCDMGAGGKNQRQLSYPSFPASSLSRSLEGGTERREREGPENVDVETCYVY